MNPEGDQLVELDILGRSYKVKVNGSPERAKKVGAMVDETMARIQKETGLTDVAKVAILTALNLSDSLLAAKDSREEEKYAISKVSKLVVDVLEDALR